ncbi:MAG TPA: HD domain-containing phosphohydrolase, partial [Dehalococcoidia bacterium]
MRQLPSQADAPPLGRLRTADLLGALSLAADLAVGLPEEHAVRACYIGMHIAERLGLSQEQRVAIYYAELLMDAGCTAWTSQFAAAVVTDEIVARRQFVYFSDDRNPLDLLSWLKDYVGVEAPATLRAKRVLDFAVHGRTHVREAFRNTCEVAQRFAGRLGMPDEVQTALLSVFEQWDGRGPHGARGEQIPIVSRIVYTTSFIEAFHRMGGRAAALRLARRRRGSAFDPAVVDAFRAVARDTTFWEGLEQETVWPAVLALEPESPCRYLATNQLEEVALAFADFADLKSAYSTGHSRRTAALAERMAAQLHLSEQERTEIRRAALMHDLGLVAVPSFTLQKPQAQRTAVERERLRLHPYHAERILAGVPA